MPLYELFTAPESSQFLVVTLSFLNFHLNFFLLSLARARRLRFWTKPKYGEKKTSREKLICGADSPDGDYGETGPLLGDGAFP